MKTAGTIASVLGAMLLGGMGGGMFKGKGKEEDEGEATKKLPSDDMTAAPKTFTPTPDTTDYKAMMDKYAAGALHSNANINKMLGDMPKIPSNFDPRAARDGGDDYRYNTGSLSTEELMGDARLPGSAPMQGRSPINPNTASASLEDLKMQDEQLLQGSSPIRGASPNNPNARVTPGTSPMRGASPNDPNRVQPINIQSQREEPGMMEKLIEQIMGNKGDSLSGVKRAQGKGAF